MKGIITRGKQIAHERQKAKAPDVEKYGDLIRQGAQHFQAGHQEFDDGDYEDAKTGFIAARKLFDQANDLLGPDRLAEGYALKSQLMIHKCRKKIGEEK